MSLSLSVRHDVAFAAHRLDRLTGIIRWADRHFALKEATDWEMVKLTLWLNNGDALRAQTVTCSLSGLSPGLCSASVRSDYRLFGVQTIRFVSPITGAPEAFPEVAVNARPAPSGQKTL